MSKEVAVTEKAGLPAILNFAEDCGAGFENTTSQDYAIPFLRMLQSGSPQAKKKDPEYVDGAEEGDLINTVTMRLYKGDEGITVIPVYYAHKYNLWAQNRGGFRGSWTTDEYANAKKQMIEISTQNGPKTVEADMDGNIITDTREHYVIIVNRDGSTSQALIALSSSQLKKSRKWMTVMGEIKINNQVAPMFSQMYKITSIGEKNDQGSWCGFNIVHEGVITSPDLYMAAKSFHALIKAGSIRVAQPEGEEAF